MSSRARVVDEEIRPYDWRGAARRCRCRHRRSFETIEVPEEPPAPDGCRAAGRAAAGRDRARRVRQGATSGASAPAPKRPAREARGLLRRLAETIEELSSTRQDMIRRTERQVVELAMAIAKQMLQRELNVDRGLLLGDGARGARPPRRSRGRHDSSPSRRLRRRHGLARSRRGERPGDDRRRFGRRARRVPRAMRRRPDERRSREPVQRARPHAARRARRRRPDRAEARHGTSAATASRSTPTCTRCSVPT